MLQMETGERMHRTHQFSTATSYRWINADSSDFGDHGGHKKKIIRAEESDFLANKIEANPVISLKELTILYNQHFSTSIASEIIQRHLHLHN